MRNQGGAHQLQRAPARQPHVIGDQYTFVSELGGQVQQRCTLLSARTSTVTEESNLNAVLEYACVTHSSKERARSKGLGACTLAVLCQERLDFVVGG